MRLTGKARPAWVEGAVNRHTEHVSVCYGESRRAVALVAPRRTTGFTVQFLLKARGADVRSSQILTEVCRELTFYLLDVVGPDSWPFVRYHCESPANRRSVVHWSWHPTPAARARIRPLARVAGNERPARRSSARTAVA